MKFCPSTSSLRERSGAAIRCPDAVAGRINQCAPQFAGTDTLPWGGRWLVGLRLNFADGIIAIDADVAEWWGHLSALRSFPVIDCLLAATAFVHDMTAVTRNLRDITDTGAAVLNPREPCVGGLNKLQVTEAYRGQFSSTPPEPW